MPPSPDLPDDEFCTDKALLLRESLRFSPRIRAHISIIWSVTAPRGHPPLLRSWRSWTFPLLLHLPWSALLTPPHPALSFSCSHHRIATDSNGNNEINQAEYLELNKKLQIAVLGKFEGSDNKGSDLAASDWLADSQGRKRQAR